MSIGNFFTGWGQSFADSLSPSSFAPPNAPVVTPDNFSNWAADGLEMLRPELKATRLASLFDQRKLEDEQKRRLLERLIITGRAELRSITDLIKQGVSTLGRWFSSFKANAISRSFAATFALFGFPTLTPADATVLGALANRQSEFIARFRDQIASGQQLVNPPVDRGTGQPLTGRPDRSGMPILPRSELYADAVWSVAFGVQHASMSRNGYTKVKSVLGVADHCWQCVDEAGRGWVGMDEYVPIGDRVCGPRCHCHLVYA